MSRLAVILAAASLASACSTGAVAGARSVEYTLADLLTAPSAAQPGVAVEGNPHVVTAEPGAVVSFNGETDRLVLRENPLSGAEEFTIEVLIHPRDVFPRSAEPRFLHIESATNPQRRLTMELRLDEKHQWYLDAFIMSEEGRRTLIDPGLVHPVGQWHHAAITWRDGWFTTWVNGRKELEGDVPYLPIPEDASTSIGARLNRVHWFAGEIAALHVTHTALDPRSFALLRRVPD